MAPNIAYRSSAIFDTVKDRGSAASQPVFRADPDKAVRHQTGGVGVEATGAAATPAAAMENHVCRSLVAGLEAFGMEEVEVQLPRSDRLICEHLARL